MLDLTKHQIEVIYALNNERFSSEKYTKLLRNVPLQTINKSKKFVNWQDAQACLLGQYLLCKGCEGLNIVWSFEKVTFSKFGRPSINQNVDFNISHSGDIVICAISKTCRLGIDIEQIRDMNLNEFKSFFDTTEWNEITFSEKPVEQFFNLWTRNEAVLKADGRGLSQLKALNALPDNRMKLDEATWKYQKINITDRHICHLAFNVENVSIQCHASLF